MLLRYGIDTEWGDPLFCFENGASAERSGDTMEEKIKGSKVVTSVWALAEPLVTGLGLTLWDVQYVKEGTNRYLRIVIDKPSGVGIDDCVAVNDALDAPLDELDPIPESYSLQVCSAGIERELKRPFHFRRYLGQRIILKLRVGYESKKLWHCTLVSYNEETEDLGVTFDNGENRVFGKKEYASVRLDDFDDNF